MSRRGGGEREREKGGKEGDGWDWCLSGTGGRMEVGMTTNGHRRSFEGDENILKLYIGDSCPTL